MSRHVPRADRRNTRRTGQIPTSPRCAYLLPRRPALSPMDRQRLSLPPEARRVPVRELPFPSPTGDSSLPFADEGHRGERPGASRPVCGAMADPSVLRRLAARQSVTSRRVHVPCGVRSDLAAPRASQATAPSQGRGAGAGALARALPHDPSTSGTGEFRPPLGSHVSGGFGGPATPGFPRGPLALRPNLTAGLPFRAI